MMGSSHKQFSGNIGKHKRLREAVSVPISFCDSFSSLLTTRRLREVLIVSPPSKVQNLERKKAMGSGLARTTAEEKV
jgi:hypothetical protein